MGILIIFLKFESPRFLEIGPAQCDQDNVRHDGSCPLLTDNVIILVKSIFLRNENLLNDFSVIK